MELEKLYRLHQECGFKDKDIKAAFERACTPENVIKLINYYGFCYEMDNPSSPYLDEE